MIGRRGVSLIEILVLMTIGSTLMGIAVGSLHLLLKMDRNTRQRRQLQASEARLADQFRRDVHAALRMKPGEAPEQSRPIWQLGSGPISGSNTRASRAVRDWRSCRARQRGRSGIR